MQSARSSCTHMNIADSAFIGIDVESVIDSCASRFHLALEEPPVELTAMSCL